MAKDRPDILVIPPLALLLAIIVSVLLERWIPLGLLPPFPWTPGLIIGLPLLAASLALDISGGTKFMREKTPINPYKTPTKIVTSGAYRFTRNPMYLGMLGTLFSLAPAFSVDWALVTTPILWAVLHYGVVLPEEAYLREKFGADYEALLASTRRWL